MTHHFIVMDAATDYSAAHYGILHKSRNVYETTQSNGPTRLVVWDNTGRINKRNGQQVNYSNYGVIDGGNGRFLDPQNQATNDPVSILLTPESSVITNSGTNTGTVASRQVYAPGKLADGDTATLSYPSGTTVEVVLHFPRHQNGHGRATFSYEGNKQ